MPILTYGSEIWICDFKMNFEKIDNSSFEKLQNMILKNILGVHGKASNLAVRCELGTMPVCIRSYKLLYKYFLRLQSFDEHPDSLHSILRAAFKEDQLLNSHNISSLTGTLSQVKKTIKLNDSCNSFIEFSDVLENFYKSKVLNELDHIKKNNSGKLLFYSKLFGDYILKDYLSFDMPKSLRSLLTRIRISAHPLNIETGRYSKPIIPSKERFCKFCTNEVEDELHFLFQCNTYNNIRIKYEIQTLNNTQIEDFMNPKTCQKTKKICNFIKEALSKRENQIAHQD